MKTAKLPNFTRFLRQRPESDGDAVYYETNKELISETMSVKDAYCNRYDFFHLVDLAPEGLSEKENPSGVALDIIWAEEQIFNAFESA